MGGQIEKSKITGLQLDELHPMPNQKGYKRCEFCRYQTEEDVAYCPKCGK